MKFDLRKTSFRCLFILMLCLIIVEAQPLFSATPAEPESPWLKAVREFGDQILAKGRDVYGKEHTPLFIDGLNINTLEPVRWLYRNNQWIISNQASQQNLFRTLTALSNLTGDPKYKNAAKEAIDYMFKNYRSANGLLYWGGHTFIDLESDTRAYGFDANSHELKNHFPFYDLMWEVDPEATELYLQAVWNAHVIDWSTLDMNRHGSWSKSMGRLWKHNFTDPEPFFEGDGLTFINAGTDLIYAAAMLYHYTGDPDALTWSKRLAYQYVKARHPETKLGVYQYSKPTRKEIPPPNFTDFKYTNSKYGDRAENQLSPEFGSIAKEGYLILPDKAENIYAHNGLIQLQLAELLGEEGREFLDWTHEGLVAYAKHAYIPESNRLRPLWADGTDLTGFVLPRNGYYGEAGTVFTAKKANSLFFYTYAYAFRLIDDLELWKVARHIALGHDLGDLGTLPGQAVKVNLYTKNSDPIALLGILNLYQAYKEPAYLELATVIGQNIIKTKYRNKFFLESPSRVNARFSALEPLALLALEAAYRNTPELVPPYNGGEGYIHGQFNGVGRTYDTRVIWSR
ncbi:MAG: pectate lyase [Firmicutes bacterium]|nr:pectate lyase [Bacillota bacterium]